MQELTCASTVMMKILMIWKLITALLRLVRVFNITEFHIPNEETRSKEIFIPTNKK